MTKNQYIKDLLYLRHMFDNKIDNEIEEALRDKADADALKESIFYLLEENQSRVLNSHYKGDRV